MLLATAFLAPDMGLGCPLYVDGRAVGLVELGPHGPAGVSLNPSRPGWLTLGRAATIVEYLGSTGRACRVGVAQGVPGAPISLADAGPVAPSPPPAPSAA